MAFSPSRSAALLTGIPEGVLAVVLFSLTVPTMRIAVRELDPVIVGIGRMALAAIPAALVLAAVGSPRLTMRQIGSLLAATACLAFGFSWFSARALREVSSSHAAIVIGVIPLVNALWASLRSGQRQTGLFWTAALAGSAIVTGYGLGRSGAGLHLGRADLLLLLAALTCGIGYAEGTRLGREIGTTALTCWVPIAAFLPGVALCLGRLPEHPGAVSTACWLALLYNVLFSSLIGMLFWYRALAKGGIARIGQIQLAQPFVTLVFSIFLLGERPLSGDWLAAGGVVACIAVAQIGARRTAAGVSLPGEAVVPA
ncbi:Permease of the drug/metabolite transporter (DMT) superfamily [Verrucomicrobium sp. GAS474]|uniref:DMT family transporter n=1 Tax=Verrucomicrobium sp. GAS474 TaxID=1882831 RepID=UPI000879AE86|nr:DMT family transporter [Verrucomicrobium sp. GAS474]SDT88059.1 Permease of the drug/metabolite transporter (DMT) superfamily [Verrucomicrobium sp. GAS474]